jgi:uncharacterized membrane protein YgcG
MAAFDVARKRHRVQIMGNKYQVAEAQRAYLRNNLKLPAMSCGVTARILLGVVQNISEHLYLLPSMKDHPQLANNPEVVAANVPLTKMELCAILKRAMPKRVVSVYEAKRNNDCPVEFDPDAMAAEFDRIFDQLSCEDKQKNNGGGDKPQANSNSAQKRGNGGARASSNGQSSGKVCKRCKQHHPDKERLWKSHATADCKKYDQDNKPIPQDGKGRGTPQKRVYALEKDDEEYTPRHRSSKKKKKSKEKKKKKSKKSSKRKKRSRSRSSSRGGSCSGSSASGSSSSSSE